MERIVSLCYDIRKISLNILKMSLGALCMNSEYMKIIIYLSNSLMFEVSVINTLCVTTK